MSNTCARIEGEPTTVSKILNFRLPVRFKRIGLYGALGTLIFLIFYRFMGSNVVLIKDILRSVILLFLLVASLSKSSIEDEYSQYIRFQSYVAAFVLTALYCIVLPLIAVGIDLLISTVSSDNVITYFKPSAFEIFSMLLGMQLLFLTILKKLGSE